MGQGVNIYGELVRAQFENLAAPLGGTPGRAGWDASTSRPWIDDGTFVRALFRNDQHFIFGNSFTVSQNVRINRFGNGVLQLLLGDDVTPENAGNTDTTKWGGLVAKLGGSYLDASLEWLQISTPGNPASGTNRLYFKSDNALYLKTSAGVETKIAGAGQTLGFGAKTSTYGILTTDDTLTGDTSSGAFTMTLPSAATAGTKVYTIQKIDTSFNALTVARAGSDTIAGGTSTLLHTVGESIRIISDGVSAWTILQRVIPSISTAYTPTFVGFGTVSGVDIYWKRNGDSVKIYGRVTAGTVSGSTWSMTLPTGTAKGPTGVFTVGFWIRNNGGAIAVKRGVLILANGDSTVKHGIDDYTTATSPVASLAGNAIFGNTQDMVFECTVPITGWNG